jgi:general stress protein 26
MDTAHDTKEHLVKVLKDFDTAMLVTYSQGVGIHARPMSIAELTANGDVVLVTRADTPKAGEILADGAAALTFQADRKFAALNGWATLEHDQTQVDRLWNPAWKVWFPQGKSDPAIRLIRFQIDNGEYWDNAGSKSIKYLLRAMSAYAKGATPATDADQHAKVTM